MNPTELQTPPTELEIAQACAASDTPINSIIRRLAFQRDRLIRLETENNGLTHRAAIDLLRKIGSYFGSKLESGVYDSTDPTHFEKWTMPVVMEYGFGPAIQSEREDGDTTSPETFPPDPEVVTVKWVDATWGITVTIIGTNIHMEGYWDSNCGGDSKGAKWQRVSDKKNTKVVMAEVDEYGQAHDHELVGPDLAMSIVRMHQTIVRLIQDGDWGNDKLMPSAYVNIRNPAYDGPMGVLEDYGGTEEDAIKDDLQDCRIWASNASLTEIKRRLLEPLSPAQKAILEGVLANRF